MRCLIVNAEKSLFDKSVKFLSLRASEGEMGIYPGHAPLLTGIEPGVLEIHLPNSEDIQHFYVSGGLLQIADNTVTVLADTAVDAEELQEESDLELQTQLKNQNIDPSHGDWQKIAKDLMETTARIRAAQLVKQLKK